MTKHDPNTCLQCWKTVKDPQWFYIDPKGIKPPRPMCLDCIKTEQDRLKTSVFNRAYTFKEDLYG